MESECAECCRSRSRRCSSRYRRVMRSRAVRSSPSSAVRASAVRSTLRSAARSRWTSGCLRGSDGGSRASPDGCAIAAPAAGRRGSIPVRGRDCRGRERDRVDGRGSSRPKRRDPPAARRAGAARASGAVGELVLRHRFRRRRRRRALPRRPLSLGREQPGLRLRLLGIREVRLCPTRADVGALRRDAIATTPRVDPSQLQAGDLLFFEPRSDGPATWPSTSETASSSRRRTRATSSSSRASPA